ncbi:MAG TPA: S9 family peptidase [Azospirillaceae bacterium]|nr:S9 family peptidase [Azospirillaceae bacterium]
MSSGSFGRKAVLAVLLSTAAAAAGIMVQQYSSKPAEAVQAAPEFRQSAFPAPPVAKQVPVQLEKHGDVRTDPYDWLRDKDYPKVDDPEVLAHLKAENDYIEQVLGGPNDLRQKLFEELKARIKEDDTSVPFKRDGFIYQVKFAAGQNYPIHVRKASDTAPEEVVLDVNKLAEGKPYMRVMDVEPTPDGRYLAYTEDDDGSERYAVKVKDLQTGKLVLEGIDDASPGVAWSKDGKTLFYTLQDEFQRPKKIMRHALGTPSAQDKLVWEEKDPAWFAGVGDTLSGDFITVGSGNNVSSEVFLIPADKPDAQPKVVAPRKQGHEYSVAHQGDSLYILTNDTHRNFRLVKAPVANPDPKNWQEVIAPTDRQYLTGLLAFKDWLVVFGRVDGGQQVWVRDAKGETHTIKFPDAVFDVSPSANFVHDSNVLRLAYDSLVTPPTVYDYDMAARTLTSRKVQEIPSGYDASKYTSERIMAPARDGTMIPVSIVYRKDFKKDGSGPLHLYAYGSYGIGMDPNFSTSRISLLDRGFAYAIAHIRGGDEMGRGWYEDGKLEKKVNTFTDFIDVAQHLAKQGYTKEGNISMQGGSAGGLLMGAVLNMAPDGLFRAAIAQVPFVDVVSTMLDDTLPLTVIEYDEWGNPNDPEVYKRLKSYSPYDNVAARDYPHILITAGLSDPRVTYWEPAKWAARLRATKTGDHVLLSRTEMEAGHGGSAGRFDKLKEVALTYAFLLRAFGKE